MTLRAVRVFITMPVTTTAQSPTDMELSGEGSDVDMIHDDDTGLDPEDDEDDEDEPEPEEVSPHCDGAQARPLTAFRRTSNQTSFLPRPRPINRGSRSSSSCPRYLAQMNRPVEARPRPAVNRAGRPRIVPSPGVRKTNAVSIFTHRRLVPDMDVESEDEDEDVGGSTRPMTSRQAVLASVVDSSHVSLCPSPSSVHRLKDSRPLQRNPLAKRNNSPNPRSRCDAKKPRASVRT